MKILNRLLDGNKRYLEKKSRLNIDTNLMHNLAKEGQKPYAIIISCSDSRVIPEQIFDANIGELFVIRTAGNTIDNNELASIEYATKHLKTKFILVLAHTHCGAIKAAIENENGQYVDILLNKIKENIVDNKDEYSASLENAKKTAEKIQELFKEETHYGIYDIESGTVKIY